MKSLFAIALLLAVGAAGAAPQTVTLSVPAMSCASCPITIKAALSKVPGVANVNENLSSVSSAFDLNTPVFEVAVCGMSS